MNNELEALKHKIEILDQENQKLIDIVDDIISVLVRMSDQRTSGLVFELLGKRENL